METVKDGTIGTPAVARPHPPIRRTTEPPPIVFEADVIRVSGKDDWRSVGIRVAAASGGTGVAAMRAIAPSAVYCAVRALIHARGLVAARGLDLQTTIGYMQVPDRNGDAPMEAIVLYCWARREDRMTWEVAPDGE